MKILTRMLLVVLMLALLAACGPSETPTPAAPDEPLLTISGPDGEQTFTLEQLQALDATDAESDAGAFTGVALSDLLTAAGFDPAQVSSVNVVATDGFSRTYESDIFSRADAVLAYTRSDGPLNSDELPLSMVIPGAEGNMQPRMVNRLEVTTE